MVTVVGKNVKKIAERKGISKEEIAQTLGWSEKETVKFLTKGRYISFLELKILSELLGTNTGVLLTKPKPSILSMLTGKE